MAKIIGIELIAYERQKQIIDYGRTAQHDSVVNNQKQLSKAARCLLYPDGSASECPKGWDLETWQRLRKKPYKERLVIAGALIAAEIDRLDYDQEVEKMEVVDPKEVKDA